MSKFRQITLLDKQWNYTYIRVLYDIITENISVSQSYINKRKRKEYCNSKKGREVNRKAGIKHYWKNRKRVLLKCNEYRKTQGGKITTKKHKMKRRKLGYFLMFENPFSKKESVIEHHITNAYVVFFPKDLHELYSGYKKERHRELCMNIVKQIYLEE